MLHSWTIRRKLVVLCSCFLLPIGFLGWLFVAQTEKDIDFAAKEVRGAAYFQGARQEMEALLDLAQGRGTAADLAKAAAALKMLDARFAVEMNAVSSAEQAGRAVAAAGALPAGAPPAAWDAAIDAVADLMAKIEDGSNLTLDPDLDSYYMQDLATVKMPALLVAAHRVQGAAAAVLGAAHPDAAGMVAFLSRKSDLATGQGGVDGDIASAERGNPDATVKPAVAAAQAALDEALTAYAAVLGRVDDGTGGARPAVAALTAAQGRVRTAARGLSTAAEGEMVHLLQARIDALSARMWRDLLVSGLISAVSLLFAAWMGRSISRPLAQLREAMRGLEAGRLETEVPFAAWRDEVGEMARSVLGFREGLVRQQRLEEEARGQQAARESRGRRIETLVDGFNRTAGQGLQAVLTSVEQLRATAGQMKRAAEDTARRAEAVSSASEQTSGNVQTVASAADQLSGAIGEISRQAEQSHSMSSNASSEAAAARAAVAALAETVRRIGAVVELINDIAGQTNLLALNATIEAARAGETGKGFAVVAGEVKTLANQTARATGEIGEQIQAVQQQTDHVVETIEAIAQVIERVSVLSSGIAAAVDQQSAATREIARNIDQAASGTQEVNRNIAGTQAAAEQTGCASDAVLQAAQGIAALADDLGRTIGHFAEGVRAV